MTIAFFSPLADYTVPSNTMILHGGSYQIKSSLNPPGPMFYIHGIFSNQIHLKLLGGNQWCILCFEGLFNSVVNNLKGGFSCLVLFFFLIVYGSRGSITSIKKYMDVVRWCVCSFNH